MLELRPHSQSYSSLRRPCPDCIPTSLGSPLRAWSARSAGRARGPGRGGPSKGGGEVPGAARGGSRGGDGGGRGRAGGGSGEGPCCCPKQV